MSVRDFFTLNRGNVLGGALIAVLAFVIYAPSLGNGFALLDDGLLIYENNAIREISPATLKAIFTNYDPELYVPLTIFSYQIDYLIGGYHPFMYHLTNLLLHVFSSLLVAWITLGLTKRKLVALFVGMLFAVHPLHSETVVWAAARKDVLSAFFFLAAFASYLSFLKKFEQKTPAGRLVPRSSKSEVGSLARPARPYPPVPMCRAGRTTFGRAKPFGRGEGWNNEQTSNESPIRRVRSLYIMSLFLFLLGLLSKVSVLTLPIILLLTEWFFMRQQVSTRTRIRALARLLPFFVLSLIFGLIALGGKSDILGAMSPLEQILLAGKSTLFVLGKLFSPIRLSPFYPELHTIDPLSPAFLLPTLILALLSFPAIFLLFTQQNSYWYTSIPMHLRRFFQDNGAAKTIGFGWLFFVITLAPTFMTPSKGGENVYVTSDRYAYLPSIGILLALGMMLAAFLESSDDARMQRKRMQSTFIGAGLVLCTFAFLTLKQSLLWGDNVALFAHAAEVTPDFYFAHINHGAALRLERRLPEAEAAFRLAIALRPQGNTHGLLAQVLAEQNKFDAAIAEFEHGMLLDPKDYELHHGLGQVYALQGRFEDALREYERALALMPEAKNAYEKLSRRIGARRDVVLLRIGILSGEQGNHERAIGYYRRALEENPLFADAHFNLAVGLGTIGKKEEALTHYEEAVRLEPTHIRARVNLAMMYAERGKLPEARKLLQDVLRDDPKNAIAREALRKIAHKK